MPHARGWAAALEAGLALHGGDAESAVERLRAAIACFDATGLRMYAAAARRRLGEALGGSEGQSTLAAGDAAMAKEAIVDIEAATEMLIPGCTL